MARARISQNVIEILASDGTDSKIRVISDCVEVLHSWTQPTAPAGSFGCAVQHDIVEVVYSDTSAPFKVSQYLVEALIVDADAVVGGPVSSGFVL